MKTKKPSASSPLPPAPTKKKGFRHAVTITVNGRSLKQLTVPEDEILEKAKACFPISIRLDATDESNGSKKTTHVIVRASRDFLTHERARSFIIRMK